MRLITNTEHVQPTDPLSILFFADALMSYQFFFIKITLILEKLVHNQDVRIYY